MSTLPERSANDTSLAHPELPAGIEPPSSRRPPWRAWTAWAAFVAALAGTFVGAGVVTLIGVAFGANASDPPPAVNIIATVIQDGCFVASALLFARLASLPSIPLPRHFGLNATRIWPALGAIVGGMLAFYVFTLAWVSAIGADPDDQEVIDQLGVEESTIAMLAAALLVTVLAPIAEEFFFRGYFYGALRNWRGPWPAAIVTGVVFGAIHGGSSDVAYLVPLAFFGLTLCLIREWTGSLYPCIALHAVNNALAFGVSQDWTWQIAVLLLAALAVLALVAVATRRVWPGVHSARLAG